MYRGSPHKGIVPPGQVARMLKIAHTRAHLGRRRTLEKLTSGNFWWPGMPTDVDAFVESCWTCARQKGRYGKRQPRPGAILKGERNFGTIYIDYVHMPQVKGFKYCLTVQCAFTRFLEVFPTKSNTAKETAYHLSRYFLRHGVPDVLSSDRGVHFANSTIEELCRSLKVTQKLHTAYRPQATGSLERVHRTLKASLFCAAADQGNTWLDNLDFMVAILNSCKNEKTNRSPYYLVHGQDWNGFTGSITSANAPATMGYGRSMADRIQRLQKATRAVNDYIDAQQKNQPGEFESPTLVPGDLVLIHRPQSVESKESKLSWIGPYKVLIAAPYAAQLENVRNGATDWVSTHHIRKVPPRPRRLEVDSYESEGEESPLFTTPVVTPAPKAPPTTSPEGLSPPKVTPTTMPAASHSPPNVASNSASRAAQNSDLLTEFFRGIKLKKSVNQSSQSLQAKTAETAGRKRPAQSPPQAPPAPRKPRRSTRQTRQPDRLTYAAIAAA